MGELGLILLIGDAQRGDGCAVKKLFGIMAEYHKKGMPPPDVVCDWFHQCYEEFQPSGKIDKDKKFFAASFGIVKRRGKPNKNLHRDYRITRGIHQTARQYRVGIPNAIDMFMNEHEEYFQDFSRENIKRIEKTYKKMVEAECEEWAIANGGSSIPIGKK